MVKQNVTFIPVKRVDTVLETALQHMPRPVRQDSYPADGGKKLPATQELYQ